MKHWLKTMEGTEPGDGLYECIDCLETFNYWPSDTEPRSNCPGKPTPVTQAIRDATTGLPESVKKRMALALGIAYEETLMTDPKGDTMSEATRPKCTNCGHPIEQAFEASGEFWGGLAHHPDLEGGGKDEDGEYRGSWYNLFWVIETDQVTRWVSDGDEYRAHPGVEK